MSRTSTSRARSSALETIFIYSSENDGGPGLQAVRSFLSGFFSTVALKDSANPIRSSDVRDRELLAARIASARVKNPDQRDEIFEPMYGEVDYELRVISSEAKTGGIVYDGRKLRRIYEPLIHDRSLSACHIVLTDRLVSTFSEDDLRHHLRTVVFGFPSIISIPGIVEAPARPREYCVQKQMLEMMGAPQIELERLKRKFAGRFIDYGDEAIGDVLKGLVLQAILFHLTLQPFCSNRGCRLFNAHWQEDLIESQISRGGLCAAHAKLIHSFGHRPIISWSEG